ncbi:MAG: hypothetical protein ABI725_03035 [Chloroflexota bacterium]
MTSSAASASKAQPRGWQATLAVLVIMVGIVGAGFVAQNAVADVPNQPVNVGHGVSLVPPPDWEFVGRADDRDTIILSRGSGSLAINVSEGTDELAALMALHDEWTATGTVSAGEVRAATDLHGSLPAARFTYSGTFEELASSVEGEVAGVRGTSVIVLFDGWADVGEFAGVADDINAIIAGTTIP